MRKQGKRTAAPPTQPEAAPAAADALEEPPTESTESTGEAEAAEKAEPPTSADDKAKAIEAEKERAAARGTDMNGINEQFKGKTLDECFALQPQPTAKKLQLDGENIGKKVDVGKLKFACVKGDFILYDEHRHVLPSGKTLHTFSAFAPRPREYLNPDPIEGIVQTLDGIKRASKKHVFFTAFTEGEPATEPLKIASFDINNTMMTEALIASYDPTKFEVELKDAHSAAPSAGAWWKAKTDPSSRVRPKTAKLVDGDGDATKPAEDKAASADDKATKPAAKPAAKPSAKPSAKSKKGVPVGKVMVGARAMGARTCMTSHMTRTVCCQRPCQKNPRRPTCAQCTRP